MSDPRATKLIDALDLLPQAARDAIAQFEFAGLTVIDANDPATVERVQTELARMLGGSPDLYPGEARKLLAALAMPRDGEERCWRRSTRRTLARRGITKPRQPQSIERKCWRLTA